MAQHTPATSRAGTFGAILRVTSGNFLEQFDFFLFGFYATYIARTFFPAVLIHLKYEKNREDIGLFGI